MTQTGDKIKELQEQLDKMTENCENWIACSEILAKKVDLMEGYIQDLIRAGDDLSYDNSIFEVERWGDLVKRVKKDIK